MTVPTAPLAEFLDMLIAKGVRRAQVPVATPDGGWMLGEFEFFAAPAAPPLPDTEPLTPEAATEDCSCGHDKDTQHGANGLCLLGCAVTLCEPATPTPGP